MKWFNQEIQSALPVYVCVVIISKDLKKKKIHSMLIRRIKKKIILYHYIAKHSCTVRSIQDNSHDNNHNMTIYLRILFHVCSSKCQLQIKHKYNRTSE